MQGICAAACGLLLVLSSAAAGAAAPDAAGDGSARDGEAWRPGFHFTPPAHWMNDPNGLVRADGEYHLFYQYHPYSSVWGPMHWGHAVSSDLLHWQHLPVALAPDGQRAIFSGSIVVDQHDTSRLGHGGRAPLVALYTIHDHALEKLGRRGRESQGLAYSTDRGRSWRKFRGNPVLTHPQAFDFRDPKLFWHAPTQRWIAALAAGDHVALYSSRDLKRWRHESDFGTGLGVHAGVWECPDLMPLQSGGRTRWLLLVSVGAGAPNGGSGTQYFVGDFDGHAFVPDDGWLRAGAAPRWVDYGTDDYAGSTWSGLDDEQEHALFIGWMSNWQYAQKVPTTSWRGAMTLPRELRLVSGPQGPRLQAQPARELLALRRRSVPLPAAQVGTDLLAAGAATGGLYELELALRSDAQARFALTLANARGEQLVLHVDRAGGFYALDRRNAGNTGFDAAFASVQRAPLLTAADAELSIHLFVDRSSVELFLDDGLTVMTALCFPTRAWDSVRVTPEAPASAADASSTELKLSAASLHELAPAPPTADP